jgi:polyhydroxyalkanoate synthesis regulator phasin
MNKLCLNRIHFLNRKIGYEVYDLSEGRLVAAKLAKETVEELLLDDLIKDGKLTNRALRFADDMLREFERLCE